MGRRIWSYLVVLILVSSLTSGCYYFSAKKEMQNAEQLISQLKAAGGDRLVPYEYSSAEKFLEVSQREFAENDHKTAKEFAVRAKSAAEAGLSKLKK
jgi:hypothetical protein